MVMGGPVMTARKKYKVDYPNLYAVPGFHKEADTFNRVQRGHQNYLEGLAGYTTMSLLGGLQHPLTVALGGIFFSFGSVLYQIGYSDVSLDVKMARHKKGGPIKWIGFFSSLICCVKFGGSLNGWW
eukprot:CAMPEP_0197824356 /NCGR_PEP_ID=MMETSP1437-20131217/1616_1 /TAXON_ID=49252 ORGANISM="Eucampia antarctica, Strain CCMP1452" /NCGR_SAMPLE_ID=MMETSP1437 /ASSEMBLY_ACC=CAM_ASM_001096 /LENGTH=125 /DNA_ID=CAMNT_0043423953 /DNA_START=128 /DNA_END=505 /DNA_ORIENTATION=+